MPFAHVTWQRHGGRAVEMAAAMGGRAVHIHPRVLRARRWVLVRYLLSAVLTLVALIRLSPRTVAVTNPPVVPGLVVAAWATVMRRPFLLDSHTGSFGVKGDRVSRRLLPVHRALARRSRAVMVTTDSWVAEVRRWGADGIVVHEAPPTWSVDGITAAPGRAHVLFPGVFADDEPVEQVVAAAALLPDITLVVTGDLARCPDGLREAAPANVRFAGFLGPEDYRDELLGCDVVVALTTEPTSVMRAAYEAVYAGRGLVVSDWPTLREVFPRARYASNDAAALAAAVAAAIAEPPPDAASRAEVAREEQLARWHGQLSRMGHTLAARPQQAQVSPAGQQQ